MNSGAAVVGMKLRAYVTFELRGDSLSVLLTLSPSPGCQWETDSPFSQHYCHHQAVSENKRLPVRHKLVETKLRTSVEAVSFVLCPPNTIAIFQAVSENRDSPYTSDLPALCLTHRPVRIRVHVELRPKRRLVETKLRTSVEVRVHRPLSAISLKRNSVPPWRVSVGEAVSFVLCSTDTTAILRRSVRNRFAVHLCSPNTLPFFRRSVRTEIRRTRRVEAKTKDPPYETRHCVETKTAVADSTLKTGGIDAWITVYYTTDRKTTRNKNERLQKRSKEQAWPTRKTLRLKLRVLCVCACAEGVSASQQEFFPFVSSATASRLFCIE